MVVQGTTYSAVSACVLRRLLRKGALSRVPEDRSTL